MDDIMYKEDFASMMKTSGIEATESNFEKVWDVFVANKNPKKSLRDNAYAAVQSVLIYCVIFVVLGVDIWREKDRNYLISIFSSLVALVALVITLFE